MARLAQVGVHVHEATQQAGGRCRSYFDAATNLTIDNGNHLLLSGNRHALAYAKSIGTEAGLVGPKLAQFPFVDITTGQRWQLDLGDGKLPLWVFDEARRVPDTGLRDYLALAPLVWAGTGKLVGDTKWYEISREVERVVRQNTKVYPNVDFYSASTYHVMGIPTELFTPLFAVSRIVGWTAHILEQWGHNRLIRPRAHYTGAVDLAYTPIDQRG